MTGDFGRKPSDWEGRWQMAKDRERAKELRLARGLPAQVPIGEVLRNWLVATVILGALAAGIWFVLGETAGMAAVVIGLILLIGVSRTWG